MIDIQFIQFYIKKKYDLSIEEYFSVSKPVVSGWRNNKFPGGRLKEFLEKEGTIEPNILFERIYPKNI